MCKISKICQTVLRRLQSPLYKNNQVYQKVKRYFTYVISDHNVFTQISNNFITHAKQSSNYLLEGVVTLLLQTLHLRVAKYITGINYIISNIVN